MAITFQILIQVIRKFLGHSDAVQRIHVYGAAMLSCSSDRSLKSWFLTPRRPDPPEPPLVVVTSSQDSSSSSSEEDVEEVVVKWRSPPAYNEAITAFRIESRIGIRDNFVTIGTVDGATLQLKVPRLVPGQCYQFRCCAINRMGVGDWSRPSKTFVSRVAAPLAIAKPVVLHCRSTATSITLTWPAPTATVPGTAIQHFNVRVVAGEVRTVSWRDAVALANDVDDDLQAQLNGKGIRRSSPASRGEMSTSSPDTKKAVVVKVVQRRRKKKNDDDSEEEDEDAVASSTRATQRMAYAYPDLEPGREYRFTVSAVSAMGEGPPSPPTYSTATLAAPPCQPFAPTGSGTSLTSLRVTWTPPSESGAAITKYEVQQEGIDRIVFPRTARTADFDGLEPGVTYAYRVRAVNRCGPSPWSEYGLITTLTGPPDAPGRPKICQVDVTSCLLRVPELQNTGGLDIITFQVQHQALRPGNAVKAPWTDVPASLRNDDGFLLVAPLDPVTVYAFRCAAVNEKGASDWSPPSFRGKTLPPKLPSAPCNPVLATAYDSGACDLVWDPAAKENGAAILSHRLHLVRLKQGDSPPPSDDASSGTTLDIGARPVYRAENLRGSTWYVFRVAAVNAVGASPFSSWSPPFKRIGRPSFII